MSERYVHPAANRVALVTFSVVASLVVFDIALRVVNRYFSGEPWLVGFGALLSLLPLIPLYRRVRREWKEIASSAPRHLGGAS
jgi:hypothetical protein